MFKPYSSFNGPCLTGDLMAQAIGRVNVEQAVKAKDLAPHHVTLFAQWMTIQAYQGFTPDEVMETFHDCNERILDLVLTSYISDLQINLL